MSANYLEEIGDIYGASIIEEGETAGKQEQLEQKTDDLNHSGPEAAEGFKPADETPGGHAEGLTQLPEEKKKKKVKKESVEINTSTMKDSKNKSTFDRLFEDVMGGDLDMELGGGDDLDLDNDDEGLGDEEGGEDVTITLSADQVSLLKDILGQLDGGEDEFGDVDDIEDIEGEGDDLEFPESHVELSAAPDSVNQLTGTNNKAGLNPDSGSADASASGQQDGGAPKAAADGKGKLQGKSNKVADLKGNAFSH